MWLHTWVNIRFFFSVWPAKEMSRKLPLGMVRWKKSAMKQVSRCPSGVLGTSCAYTVADTVHVTAPLACQLLCSVHLDSWYHLESDATWELLSFRWLLTRPNLIWKLLHKSKWNWGQMTQWKWWVLNFCLCSRDLSRDWSCYLPKVWQKLEWQWVASALFLAGDITQSKTINEIAFCSL